MPKKSYNVELTKPEYDLYAVICLAIDKFKPEELKPMNTKLILDLVQDYINKKRWTTETKP